MIIGYDFHGEEDTLIFETKYSHPTYHKAELKNSEVNQFFIDEDTTISDDTSKPLNWNFTTVINALFQGDLEGGSVSANGLIIDRISFQKRKADDLYWDDIEEIPYDSGEKTLYEAIDKYIQNDFSYEYSLTPIASTVQGNRTVSTPIRVNFEGNFLSDINENYRLLYDFELGTIEHNSPSAIHQPLNSKYPIVTYSNTDYRSSSIDCLILTDTTVNNGGTVNIRNEKLQREKLIKFLKNRKPKIMRSQNGDIMMIAITDNPREEPNNSIHGIAKVSFSFVEIGSVDSDNLRANGLIKVNSLEEVF